MLTRVHICIIYVSCSLECSSKCCHPTHGDDLHHHLQQRTHYVRQGSAAEVHFLHHKPPRRFKPTAVGEAGHIRYRTFTQMQESVPFLWPPTLLSHPGKVSTFTPWQAMTFGKHIVLGRIWMDSPEWFVFTCLVSHTEGSSWAPGQCVNSLFILTPAPRIETQRLDRNDKREHRQNVKKRFSYTSLGKDGRFLSYCLSGPAVIRLSLGF